MNDIFFALPKFHLDMSGSSYKVEHKPNNPNILLILFKFHLEISGNSFKDEYPKNNPDISLT